MNAGARDRLIQFRRATQSSNALGRVEDFTDHGLPVRAEKLDISDGERWRAHEVQAHVTTRFRVAWSTFTSAITPKDALVCEGLTYDIVGIKETEGRRRSLEITAAARVDK
jgi:head-tail adaptor